MKHINGRIAAVVGGAVVLAALSGTSGAFASRMITSSDIRDGAVHRVDLSDGVNTALNKHATNGVDGKNGKSAYQVWLDAGNTGSQADFLNSLKGAQGDQGVPGAKGDQGPQGVSGLKGAYYSVANYDVGDTNAGAIATVVCNSHADVAISGGVQTVGLHQNADGSSDNSYNTPVSSSFPGRMNWDTNTPRPGDLSGWVVQFGGNAGATSDKAPEKTKIWALCVPGTDISATETYTESTDN